MIPFPVLLAWREARAGVRRVGLYGLSIGLGVAALVSVHGFRQDVAHALDAQARTLLGADVELESNRALPDSVTTVIDSLAAEGVGVARVVGAVSMVAGLPSEGARPEGASPPPGVRLLQVRAVGEGWPFYGDLRARPEGAWSARLSPGEAVVDPAVLTQLGVNVGDSLSIGRARFRIAGSVEDMPGDLGFQTTLGPRVWLGLAGMEAAELLTFGSLARYQTYLRFDDQGEAADFREIHRELFRATGVGVTTAEGRARGLTRAVGDLGRFLGLVGLGALLLGGLGVASAVRVFVRERLTQVAVLRCMGARQNGLFAAYLMQAAALGLTGSLLGAAAGVLVQHVLPGALAGVLPIDVTPRVWWTTVAAGVGVGVWVAVLFALLPLLGVRGVPPLRALRSEVEGPAGAGRLARAVALLALAASVLTLAVIEAPSAGQGVGFAVGLAVVTGLFWALARGLVAASRRLFPRRAPYPVRQGYSNLFRPGNQTVGITMALGLGAFVVGMVLQVEANLSRALALDVGTDRPDLLFFDVQTDQREAVLDVLPPEARASAVLTPLVSARLAGINGRDVASLQRDTGRVAPAGWALRREYRHTWRAELTDAETLVDGAWWNDAPESPSGMARVSVEDDLAASLGVTLGDTLLWTVAGREVPSLITSLRRVDWQRFQTNFFVVFEPGSLDDAPATWVALARVGDADERLAVQRRLVQRLPNVSVLDVSRVREVIEAVLGRVAQAVRFLAVFAAAAGGLVLAGALATSRQQRAREGALLRTLGARRGQLLTVLFSEFVALGALAGLAGLTLSVAGAWLLVSGDFGLDFEPAWTVLAGVWAGMLVLTVLVGLVTSRGLLSRPPLTLLAEAP